MTGTEVVERAAQRLRDAAGRGVPCLPIRDLVSDGDVATAYAVQRRNLDLRLAGGARRVGRKIGLTSAAVQNQLGVTQPDTGWLFDDMAVPSGGTVPAGRLLQPRVEAEVAFWLAADIPADVDSIDDVRAVISTAVAAIEIVDSRVRDWDISHRRHGGRQRLERDVRDRGPPRAHCGHRSPRRLDDDAAQRRGRLDRKRRGVPGRPTQRRAVARPGLGAARGPAARGELLSRRARPAGPGRPG